MILLSNDGTGWTLDLWLGILKGHFVVIRKIGLNQMRT